MAVPLHSGIFYWNLSHKVVTKEVLILGDKLFHIEGGGTEQGGGRNGPKKVGRREKLAQKVGRREKLARKVGRREIYSTVPPPSMELTQSKVSGIYTHCSHYNNNKKNITTAGKKE